MTAELLHIDIREARPEDEAVIFSTWLKSFRYGEDPKTPCEDAIFFGYHRPLILRIIERAGTQVAVATLPDDTKTVLGWAVAEPPSVLHYVYVKAPFRRLRVASRLLGRLGVDLSKPCQYSHRTKFLVQAAASARWPRLTFNPYIR